MNFKRKTTKNLLVYYSEILKELRRREVVRTSNSPTGDYAELLACQKFHLRSAPKGTKSYDAVDAKGKRYQVKSRRITPENKTQLLGVIRYLDTAKFDYLVVVIFNEDFSVKNYYIMPKSIIKKYARYSSHQNGHILNMRGSIKNNPRVKIFNK